MPAVVMEAVTKTYRGRRGRPPQKALDNLDLLVESGGVHGFLGPNGSGKTTSIRVLLGLVSADSGTARIFDRPVPQALPEVIGHVGALVETPLFFPNFSGRRNLQLLAEVAGVASGRQPRSSSVMVSGSAIVRTVRFPRPQCQRCTPCHRRFV